MIYLIRKLHSSLTAHYNIPLSQHYFKYELDNIYQLENIYIGLNHRKPLFSCYSMQLFNAVYKLGVFLKAIPFMVLLNKFISLLHKPFINELFINSFNKRIILLLKIEILKPETNFSSEIKQKQ